MKKIGLIVCALVLAWCCSAAPAFATCPCLHEPCNFQECPPDESGSFSQVRINGTYYPFGQDDIEVDTGNGTVTLDLGSIGYTIDANDDNWITHTMEVEDPVDGLTITATTDGYELINGVWTLVEANIDTQVFLYSELPASQQECEAQNDWSHCQSLGQCSGACYSARWCTDYCALAIGQCFHPTSTQWCICSADTPSCGTTQSISWWVRCNWAELKDGRGCRLQYLVEIQPIG